MDETTVGQTTEQTTVELADGQLWRENQIIRRVWRYDDGNYHAIIFERRVAQQDEEDNFSGTLYFTGEQRFENAWIGDYTLVECKRQVAETIQEWKAAGYK